MKIVRSSGIVKFFFPEVLCRIKVQNPQSIYLTFDDGPNPNVTPLVLDILYKSKVNATFFCLGQQVEKHQELYNRIINEGHAVGNHTYSHADGWKTSAGAYANEVKKCSGIVQSNLFRPPYGRLTLRQYRLLNNQYRIVLWDVLSGDYNMNYSKERCIGNVVRNTRNGSILLFHDNDKTADKYPEMLVKTIEILKEKGYYFETLKEKFN